MFAFYERSTENRIQNKREKVIDIITIDKVELLRSRMQTGGIMALTLSRLGDFGEEVLSTRTLLYLITV